MDKMNESFIAAFGALMAVEKGYWDDPAGGPTMYGVTERVARAWGYQGDMRALPLLTAQAIAKSEYWDRFQCDQFAPAISYQVFDAAYNGGHPVQWLQQAVGVEVDGKIGPKTVAALRAADPSRVVLQFNAARIKYLTSLDGWASNGKGWARRIADNLLKGVA
jgi:lysozyme family protein